MCVLNFYDLSWLNSSYISLQRRKIVLSIVINVELHSVRWWYLRRKYLKYMWYVKVNWKPFFVLHFNLNTPNLLIYEEFFPVPFSLEDLIVVLYDSRRAVSSSSVDGICAMLNHASTVLEQDFREVLFSRVRAGFPSGFDLTQAYNMVQSSIQQGKLQSSDQEKAKTTFLVRVL